MIKRSYFNAITKTFTKFRLVYYNNMLNTKIYATGKHHSEVTEQVRWKRATQRIKKRLKELAKKKRFHIKEAP